MEESDFNDRIYDGKWDTRSSIWKKKKEKRKEKIEF